jgi:hypothetical protein
MGSRNEASGTVGLGRVGTGNEETHCTLPVLVTFIVPWRGNFCMNVVVEIVIPVQRLGLGPRSNAHGGTSVCLWLGD